MLIEKSRQTITTMEQWEALAPPKNPAHWVEGRSAMEAARAWLAATPSAPPEVVNLLATNENFCNVVLDFAEPEAHLRFDRHRNPRNADLAIWAHDDIGPLAITVEAKADEEFGDTVSGSIAAALETRIDNPRSGALTRITDLCLSLFGSRAKGEATITSLRYQLLTAVAGSLALAATIDAKRAVLIVEEFVTTKTSKANIERNANDLNRFLQRLSRSGTGVFNTGKMHGPFVVTGEPLFCGEQELYIGKVSHFLGEPIA